MISKPCHTLKSLGGFKKLQFSLPPSWGLILQGWYLKLVFLKSLLGGSWVAAIKGTDVQMLIYFVCLLMKLWNLEMAVLTSKMLNKALNFWKTFFLPPSPPTHGLSFLSSSFLPCVTLDAGWCHCCRRPLSSLVFRDSCFLPLAACFGLSSGAVFQSPAAV